VERSEILAGQGLPLTTERFGGTAFAPMHAVDSLESEWSLTLVA
jgi:hypothetical protein